MPTMATTSISSTSVNPPPFRPCRRPTGLGPAGTKSWVLRSEGLPIRQIPPPRGRPLRLSLDGEVLRFEQRPAGRDPAAQVVELAGEVGEVLALLPALERAVGRAPAALVAGGRCG